MQLPRGSKSINYVCQRSVFVKYSTLQEKLQEARKDRGEAHEGWERRDDDGIGRAGLAWR